MEICLSSFWGSHPNVENVFGEDMGAVRRAWVRQLSLKGLGGGRGNFPTYGIAWEGLAVGVEGKGALFIGASAKWKWSWWWEASRQLGEERGVVMGSQGAPDSSFYIGATLVQ